MRHYRRAAHTVFELHYHFVFATKYRKPALQGEVAHRLRDLIREITPRQRHQTTARGIVRSS